MRHAPRTPCLATRAMLFGVCSMAAALQVPADSVSPLVTGGASAWHRGVWQAELPLDDPRGNPFLDVELRFIFTLPDGKEIKAEGFYRGGNQWAGRAYCAQTGPWKWRSVANRPSPLPGKLRLDGGKPLDLPMDQWVRYVITGTLGVEDGKWSLAVTLPGQETKTFTDLPYQHQGFRQLTWFGLMSTANATTTSYIDGVSLSVK